MEVKLGHKQTEERLIPKDWSVTSLLNVLLLPSGQVDPRRKPYSSMVLIAPDHIEAATGRLLVQQTSAEQGAISGKYEFNSGDIVYSKIRPYLRKAILADFDGLCSADMYPLSTIPGVSPEFMLAVLLGHDFSTFAETVSARSGIPKINRNELAEYRVSLPPLNEQTNIAEVLRDTDALIESLEQLLTKKRQIKKGAMQELLTGKKRLLGFSGEWETGTFGEIFQYYPTATNSRDDLLSAGDTFYIHYGDIHTRFHNHLDFGVVTPPRIDRSRCSNATLLKNGDWVMADASEDHEGVGKFIEIQGLNTNMAAVAGLHTFLLREKKPTFSPSFKGHLGNLRSLHDQFLRVATGLKVFGVSKAALKDIEIPIPHPEEQTAIANILSDIDEEITALEAKLSKARQLKQGMMQELLTGRIRLL